MILKMQAQPLVYNEILFVGLKECRKEVDEEETPVMPCVAAVGFIKRAGDMAFLQAAMAATGIAIEEVIGADIDGVRG